MANTVEVWTDQIQDTGIVIRVYLHALIKLSNGELEWHYWGTDPQEKPPTGIYADEPIFEHAYIQFPQAFNDLPANTISMQLYEIALMAGMSGEGLS